MAKGTRKPNEKYGVSGAKIGLRCCRLHIEKFKSFLRKISSDRIKTDIMVSECRNTLFSKW